MESLFAIGRVVTVTPKGYTIKVEMSSDKSLSGKLEGRGVISLKKDDYVLANCSKVGSSWSVSSVDLITDAPASFVITEATDPENDDYPLALAYLTDTKYSQLSALIPSDEFDAFMTAVMNGNDENRTNIPHIITTGTEIEMWKLFVTSQSLPLYTFEVQVEEKPVSIQATPVEEFPEWVDNFWLSEELRFVGGMLRNHFEAGNPFFNLLFLGPAGYGKTSAAQAFAKHLQMSYLRNNCAMLTDTTDLTGRVGLSAEGTYFKETLFTQLLRQGRAVLLLDEVTRTRPSVLNALMDILDDGRQTILDNAEVLRFSPYILFVGTANVGSKYSGTYTMDAALRSRFGCAVTAEPPPPAIESDAISKRSGVDIAVARKIVSVISEMRGKAQEDNFTVDISTRSAIAVAQLVAMGAPLKRAFQLGIINLADMSDTKPLVDILNMKVN